MERKFKHWNPKEDLLLVKLYNEGKSYAEIAEEMGRSSGACSIELAKLREQNIFLIAPKRAVNHNDHPITDEEIRRFKELRKEGKIHKEIADVMGLSTIRVGSISRRILNLARKANKIETAPQPEPEIPFVAEQPVDGFGDFLRAFYDFLGNYLNK